LCCFFLVCCGGGVWFGLLGVGRGGVVGCVCFVFFFCGVVGGGGGGENLTVSIVKYLNLEATCMEYTNHLNGRRGK